MLKDAASASIYGSRAASGVIVITTKRAKNDQASIQYSYENNIPLPNIYTINRQENSLILATPSFAYEHSNAEVSYPYNSTPTWLPPTWVPLNRYDQYQMGLMGSTPYYISDYSQLHPDHEEE